MKIVKISVCSECPNLVQEWFCHVEYNMKCILTKATYMNFADIPPEIPPDCPLDDVKESEK